MASTGPLLSMTPELVQLMLDKVDASDLPNVRLTCKALEYLSREQFGTKRLASRRFVMSQHSLKGLVLLVHHKHLGQYVKSISISTYRIDARYGKLLYAMKAKGILESMTDAEYFAMVKKYDAAALEQKHFLACGAATKYLCQAFRVLKDNNQIVDFGVYDDVQLNALRTREVTIRGFGYDKAYKHLPLDSWYIRAGSTLARLMEASVEAHYRPNYIHASLGEWNNGNMCDNLRFDTMMQRLMTASLTGHIRNGMNFDLSISCRHRILIGSSHASLTLTRNKGQQESARYNGHAIQFLRTRVFLPQITTFKLDNCHMLWDDFVAFLQLRGRGLSVLSVAHARFTNSIPPVQLQALDLPQLLKQYLPFEQVVLEDIYAARLASLEVLVQGKLSWKGDGVLVGLNMMIEAVEEKEREKEEPMQQILAYEAALFELFPSVLRLD